MQASKASIAAAVCGGYCGSVQRQAAPQHTGSIELYLLHRSRVYVLYHRYLNKLTSLLCMCLLPRGEKRFE
jgi:hypothetical protein